MTPEQGKFLQQLALTNIERESATTRKLLEAVPPEKADYRPEPVAKSAFELVWHIASAENMFLDAVLNGKFNFDNPRPESVRTTADIARWYGEQIEQKRQRMAQMSGDDLVRSVDFRGFMQMPAIFYVNLALMHSSHHRGQLSVYLRPMGGKVPAIYGESYDSAQARAAQQ